MGKILNLISLKAKADAAGVGTTATNSTPSLCPLKSAIAGYVTNGSSTVSISGSWANNLLVDEDYVAIGKTITGTTTVYRNVSVGSSSASDIPAAGGSSRASATVTYEYATKTTYSDGTSTTGSYTSGSTTIYGSYVSANSKGTSVSLRSSTGSTSTPSGTVAGATRTGSAVTIYLAANKATAIDVSIISGYSTWFTYDSVIPSPGGPANPTWHVTCTVTFSSGSTSTFTPNSGTNTIIIDNIWRINFSYNFVESSDPSGAFSVSATTGLVTASANSSTSQRSAVYTSALSCSVTYENAYSSLYNSGVADSVTSQATCYLAGSSGSVGFTAQINLYMHGPRVAFKSSSGTHYTVAERTYNGTNVTLSNLTFSLSGTATYVDVTYNDPRCGYITIKRDSTTILAKTYIGGANSNRNLTLSSGLASSFTGTLYITFSPT